jgi:NADPH:quinone reductase-like Zn-dependent oxidoreductase
LATQAFPNPEPKWGHVVMDVKASGVNHSEPLMLKGEWMTENPVHKVSKEKVRNLIEL